MRIVSYDELRDPRDFLELMEACFGEISVPEHPDLLQRHDERRKHEFGFGVYRGKTLASFIGVAELKVRTRSGKTESALGIHHVATHPAFARQGLCRRLFDFVHDRYCKEGRRFSFLYTSRSLVARSLYCELGYKEILMSGTRAPRALLILPPTRKRPERNRTRIADLAVAERLFAEATAGEYGFVVRPHGWVLSRLKQWKMKTDYVFIDRDGYAFTNPDRFGRYIEEFICRNRTAYVRLLNRIIAATRGGLVHYYVRDPILGAIYKERGARFRYETYASLMVKPLTRASFPSVFGPRLFQSPVDQF
ncbi:GNAT family N-acetyltransferase [candidate division WOR-3 bacterium]|uniref:GNAT family N-acetyltransferase n=1 Tax=candidate division WOR-3 bacterium TaxID=2052148 RepID=A0A937XHG3_UNCW3|nr:GNAT family N-acetyltransferase [candidate division WOR-3 bacterium]